MMLRTRQTDGKFRSRLKNPRWIEDGSLTLRIRVDMREVEDHPVKTEMRMFIDGKTDALRVVETDGDAPLKEFLKRSRFLPEGKGKEK